MIKIFSVSAISHRPVLVLQDWLREPMGSQLQGSQPAPLSMFQ